MRRESNKETRTGDTTAHNIHAGRDFTQINNSITQSPHPNQQSSETNTPPADSWLQVFRFLLKPSSITIPRLNTLFRASFLGSLVVILGTLTAVIPNYTPLFSTGYPLAPNVFFPVLFSASLVAYISKEYFRTRESSTCPACNTEFSFIPTRNPNTPTDAFESSSFDSRTTECTHCDYAQTDPLQLPR
jgi:hypothetical protein